MNTPTQAARLTVREVLARRGYREPVRIERTQQQPGHVVLRSWALPSVVIGEEAF